MDQAKLNEILRRHDVLLLTGFQDADLRDTDLQKADLREINLQGAKLDWANLRGANLWKADLRGARLWNTDMRGADLQESDLRGADMRDADMRGTDLYEADLWGADLRGTNLQDANLMWAKLAGAKLPDFQVCPEKGEFTAWKKVREGVVKLLVPAHAERTSSLVGRKCRASSVVVMEGPALGESWYGLHNGTQYKLGKEVAADRWDGDVRLECTHGIHFFVTRKEAEEW